MKLTIRIATLCLTIIAAVGSSTVWAEVCPSTNYSLTTQAQVDALGATGCDAISGSLSIYGTDITSLSSLSGITSVGGALEISNTTALTNLDGLSGITSVGGVLNIYSNVVLTNLDGLAGITSVGGNLYIWGNDALTNLDGLSGITSVGGFLYISDNAALTNLDGLSGLTSVGGSLDIRSNINLGDCVGIAPVLGWPDGPPDDLVVGAITVQSNTSGCNSVEEILASVTVPSQPVITSVAEDDAGLVVRFTLASDGGAPITTTRSPVAVSARQVTAHQSR